MLYDYERRRYWAEKNRRDREWLLERICFVDGYIKSILFSFDTNKLNKFFSEYERQHGRRAMLYAKRSFDSWKKKSKKISNLILGRMIDIAPRFFENEQRYSIIRDIYNDSKNRFSYQFEVILGNQEDVNKIISVFINMCDKPFSHNISSNLKDVMSWVCDSDVKSYNRILSALDSEMSVMILESAKLEMFMLMDRIKQLDSAAVGSHRVSFPFGTISIKVRNPTTAEKIFRHLKGFFS